MSNLTGKTSTFNWPFLWGARHYSTYIDEFFTRYSRVSFDNLRRELEMTPPEMFGRRDKYYKALICFGKFLIQENSLEPDFLQRAKSIEPKRHIPPKQVCISEKDLEALLEACSSRTERLIVTFLSQTGVRASEFCDLKLEDVHLKEGYVVVQKGKGGKRRRVGLTHALCQMLADHIAMQLYAKPEDYLFPNKYGAKMDRHGLSVRILNLGKRAGIRVHPHALRRAFVTHNANKGRSLVMLQIACGHSDIKTTRAYCRTSEDEVINAMKDWG